MQRRGFIAAFGATAIALPFVARAQQATPVVGLLSSASSRDYGPMIAAFRKSLSEAGSALRRALNWGPQGPSEAIP
jgi:putative tryptophan/tyrosine transport system substrate-binding protein